MYEVKICDVPDCGKVNYSLGKCKHHYNKLPHVLELKSRSHRNNPRKCSLVDCGKPHAGLGLCSYHYSRLPQVREKENARRRKNPRQAELRKKYLKERKHLVLFHYSNGSMVCECCGEKTFEFLTINHINGGGLRHNKALKASGTTLYPYLKQNNFPEGYNVLCMNCNFADGQYGQCPHKIIKDSSLLVIQRCF